MGPGVQDPRRAVDYLPKFIVLVGVLFLIPHYQWEYYAAGTLKVSATARKPSYFPWEAVIRLVSQVFLKGYIGHLQNLIQIIKAKCEKVPSYGHHGGRHVKIKAIFDESSETFSNTHKYKKFMHEDFMVQARKRGKASFFL